MSSLCASAPLREKSFGGVEDDADPDEDEGDEAAFGEGFIIHEYALKEHEGGREVLHDAERAEVNLPCAGGKEEQGNGGHDSTTCEDDLLTGAHVLYGCVSVCPEVEQPADGEGEEDGCFQCHAL